MNNFDNKIDATPLPELNIFEIGLNNSIAINEVWDKEDYFSFIDSIPRDSGWRAVNHWVGNLILSKTSFRGTLSTDLITRRIRALNALGLGGVAYDYIQNINKFDIKDNELTEEIFNNGLLVGHYEVCTMNFDEIPLGDRLRNKILCALALQTHEDLSENIEILKDGGRIGSETIKELEFLNNINLNVEINWSEVEIAQFEENDFFANFVRTMALLRANQWDFDLLPNQRLRIIYSLTQDKDLAHLAWTRGLLSFDEEKSRKIFVEAPNNIEQDIGIPEKNNQEFLAPYRQKFEELKNLWQAGNKMRFTLLTLELAKLIDPLSMNDELFQRLIDNFTLIDQYFPFSTMYEQYINAHYYN